MGAGHGRLRPAARARNEDPLPDRSRLQLFPGSVRLRMRMRMLYRQRF